VNRPGLAYGDEADAEPERHAGPEHEATGLDCGDLGHAVTFVRHGERGHGLGEELTVDEQPRDVGVPLDPAEAPEELVLEGHRQILMRRPWATAALPRRDGDPA
jgi:hypothetical protein